MAQLFVPLTGAFGQVAGSGVTTDGEDLERPTWKGAELGFLESFADAWAAVAEAEARDWIIGVRHPLYVQGGPAQCRFLDPDPAVRAEALKLATNAALGARQIGARYIQFHFPLPGFASPGHDHAQEGWPVHGHPLSPLEGWSEAQLYEESRRIFEQLAEVQVRQSIQVVLEIDGPSPCFFEGDLYNRLFAEFPDLSLCLDTGLLGLLARVHGQDPLELTRRWLPWIRHLHLHTSRWDADGRYMHHLPTTGEHTADKWPQVTPAADIARLVLSSQPRCIVVLDHQPKAAAPEELGACHAWVSELLRSVESL